MEYVTLGKSDLKVSRICMGCMGFGNAQTGQHSWTVDEETSTLLKYDVVNMDGSVQSELLQSIMEEGIILYEKI